MERPYKVLLVNMWFIKKEKRCKVAKKYDRKIGVCGKQRNSFRLLMISIFV
ncbi:MAG: hypothetical protein AAGJ08_14710 [Cyanobacteria bacterium P01_H01_bin.35]